MNLSLSRWSPTPNNIGLQLKSSYNWFNIDILMLLHSLTANLEHSPLMAIVMKNCHFFENPPLNHVQNSNLIYRYISALVVFHFDVNFAFTTLFQLLRAGRKNCSSQPSMFHWLSSPIFPFLFVCPSRYGDIFSSSTSTCPRPPNPYIFWKLMIIAIQKWIWNTNTKTMTKTKRPTE